MICVSFFKASDGSYLGFQVSGHADSVEEGADLVCCSVSVLTINLENSLEQLTSDQYDLKEDSEEGFVEIRFREKPSREAVLLLQSYELGISSITGQYGTWLKVMTKEV